MQKIQQSVWEGLLATQETLRSFLKWLKGLSYKNECPNCRGSLLKKGEGEIITVNPANERGLISISLCLVCLENPTSLKATNIKATSKRWGYNDDDGDVKLFIESVEKFKRGEIGYTVCNPKADDQ